jgi:hypothetical protein
VKSYQLPATSYQLPSNFESTLLIGSIATTAATSYQPVFKNTLSFEEEKNSMQKLPATIQFSEYSFIRFFCNNSSYQLPSIF